MSLLSGIMLSFGNFCLIYGNKSISMPLIINYLVKLCRHTVGGRVGVGFVQQGLDGRQDGGHVVGWRPPVLQDVQTNSTVRVHVRVKHFTDKSKNKKVYKPIFNPRHFYIFYGRFILLS